MGKGVSFQGKPLRRSRERCSIQVDHYATISHVKGSGYGPHSEAPPGAHYL